MHWLIFSWHNHSTKIQGSFGCIICIVLGVDKVVDKLPLGCLSSGYQVFVNIKKAIFNRLQAIIAGLKFSKSAITSTPGDFILPGLNDDIDFICSVIIFINRGRLEYLFCVTS